MLASTSSSTGLPMERRGVATLNRTGTLLSALLALQGLRAVASSGQAFPRVFLDSGASIDPQGYNVPSDVGVGRCNTEPRVVRPSGAAAPLPAPQHPSTTQTVVLLQHGSAMARALLGKNATRSTRRRRRATRRRKTSMKTTTNRGRRRKKVHTSQQKTRRRRRKRAKVAPTTATRTSTVPKIEGVLRPLTTTTAGTMPSIGGSIAKTTGSAGRALGRLTGHDYQSFRRWMSGLLRVGGGLYAPWEAALNVSKAEGGLLGWLWADVKDVVVAKSFSGWLDQQEESLQPVFAWMGADGAEQMLLQGFEETFVPALREVVDAEYCALKLPGFYGPEGQLPLVRNRPPWHKWAVAAPSVMQQERFPSEMPGDFEGFWEDSLVRMVLPAFDTLIQSLKGHIWRFFSIEVLFPAFSETMVHAQRDDKLWDAYHEGGKAAALPVVRAELDKWWQATAKEEQRPDLQKRFCKAVEFKVVNGELY